MRHKPFPGFSVALAGIALLVMATGPAIFTSAATEAPEPGPERAPQVAMAIRAFNFSLARDDIDAAHGAPILAALESGRIPPKGAQVMADFLHMPAAMRSQRLEGALAFMFEDFEGNGRTCETCHGLDTGTFTLEQVRARYAQDPRDPLFRALDSDAGDGRSYARLLANGTVSVRIPLPMGVKLVDDPTAHDAVLFRGTPSFFNSAALDPVLMHDGRAPDLQSQAHDALETHAEVARMPSLAELDAIAEFQRAFFTFSDNERPSYGTGNPKNELPEGRTDAERRGRLFFVDMPVDPRTGPGVCAACHSGPLWNETNEHVATFFPRITGVPGAGRPIPTESGMRLLSNGSAERNMAGLPMRHWQLQGSDGAWVSLESPDVGAALAPKVTGVSDALQARLSPAMRANLFKITSLRAIAATPPYFHDNSALSLEDVVEHYAVFLDKGVGNVRPATSVTLSTQDKADIVAYLKLL